MADSKSSSAYWRTTVRLSVGLLAVWALLTFGVGLFGRSLDFRLFGWHLGFWLTAQVALIGFCVIVWVYAFAMDRLDQIHEDDEGD